MFCRVDLVLDRYIVLWGFLRRVGGWRDLSRVYLGVGI